MEKEEFYLLGQLIGGYLNQDMDMWAESVPEAVAKFAAEADSGSRRTLADELDLFQSLHHNNLEEEFRRRYWFDFTPDLIGQTVPEFFAMTKAILDDPSDWRRFNSPQQNEN